MSTKSSVITVELTPAIFDELLAITQRLGITSPEVLVKNYIREVIIAARIDQATVPLREAIVRGASDLDPLNTKVTKKVK